MDSPHVQLNTLVCQGRARGEYQRANEDNHRGVDKSVGHVPVPDMGS
jgi:hypothetical protein